MLSASKWFILRSILRLGKLYYMRTPLLASKLATARSLSCTLASPPGDATSAQRSLEDVVVLILAADMLAAADREPLTADFAKTVLLVDRPSATV